MSENSNNDLLAEVATMYYIQEKTQAEIGKRLDISRTKVYRLLQDAKEEGIVEISINWEIKRQESLERELLEKFSLKDAIVLHLPDKQTYPVLTTLGRVAGNYLERLMKDETTMAICLGRSTLEVINAIRPGLQAKVNVVQAIGSMPGAMKDADSSAIARNLAEKLGGQVSYLSSPPVANSSEDVEVMLRQRSIGRVLSVAQSADVALVGIGNLDPETFGFVRAGYISRDELEELVAEGAVGDISGRIFNIEGKLHPCAFNDRVIGITLEELSQIPCTLAVARGIEKARSILGALRTGAIGVLATDDQTASAVLQLATSAGKSA